jgi:hypothetical protein
MIVSDAILLHAKISCLEADLGNALDEIKRLRRENTRLRALNEPVWNQAEQAAWERMERRSADSVPYATCANCTIAAGKVPEEASEASPKA